MGKVIFLKIERERREGYKTHNIFIAFKKSLSDFEDLDQGEQEKQRGRYKEDLQVELRQVLRRGFSSTEIECVIRKMKSLGLLD